MKDKKSAFFNRRKASFLFACILTLLVSHTLTAQAQSAYVKYTTASDYGSGYSGEIKIFNAGSQPINGWTLAFNLNRSISTVWNAKVSSHVGPRYTVINETFNGTIPAGESVTFGFTASPGNVTASDAPSNFTLNGVSIGTEPPNTQTATTFTYQGKLTERTTAANGTYDFQFALYDDAGNQIGTTLLREDINVSGGIFNALLDFGANAFNGANCLLEIRVRAGNSTGAFTVLAPRQPITAAPLAIRSTSAATADTALNVSGGAIQLPLTNGAPTSANCNSQTRGQMTVDPANAKLYICVASGWKSTTLQ